MSRTFHIEIIKPSHYDKDGYVIQWWKAWIPSNSMACLYAIAQDCAERKVLGDDVSIEVDGYDEMNIKVPIASIAARLKQPGHSGIVCLVGVQSNQFPRAMALARQLRALDIPVAIGGFHVSGCISMLRELTPELREALDLGIILFAGEAEEHFESFLKAADTGTARKLYNYMDALPNLQRQTIPYLPRSFVRRYDGALSSFDAGRGCPFQCSFCTIINVQGRKSRWRDADDIERIVVENAAQGIGRFFVTDDNFARNSITFLIQIDTLAHKIPNFIEKAARAGCRYVFVGLESINPENLLHMKKNQNRITEYRKMFQAWKEAGIMIYAGFIMGLPGDTPETIHRDIQIIQKELPVDLLEFTMLTPLPGSEDHKTLYENGTWMDPDLNKYDLETVTVAHPKMSRDEWQDTYNDMWRLVLYRGACRAHDAAQHRLRNKAGKATPRGSSGLWSGKFRTGSPAAMRLFSPKGSEAAPARTTACPRDCLLSAAYVADDRQICPIRALRAETLSHAGACRERAHRIGLQGSCHYAGNRRGNRDPRNV